MTDRVAGVVREWHDELGWGVLTSPALDDTVWAHFSSILDQEGVRGLRAGQDVEFTWERAEQDGHHLRAVGVWSPGGATLPAPAPVPAHTSALHVTFDSATVFCAVYGEIDVHPWIDPAAAEEDAYSLFVARSVALGWWTQPGTERWAMNDAAGAWQVADDEHDEAAANAAVGGNRIAWFQVGLPQDDRPGPVQAVVACAQDVVERVGRVDLAAVQVLVPMRAAGLPVASGLGWFGLTDPAARTTLRVTADAGDEPTPGDRAVEVLEFLQQRHTGPFRVTGVGADPVEPQPTVAGEHWIRPGRFPLTLVVEAPEWSFAAAGQLIDLVADACREVGTRGDVLLSVAQSP